jgi:hypothetical protein
MRHSLSYSGPHAISHCYFRQPLHQMVSGMSREINRENYRKNGKKLSCFSLANSLVSGQALFEALFDHERFVKAGQDEADFHHRARTAG